MINVSITKTVSVDKEIEFSDILDRFHKDETIFFPKTGWKPHKKYVTKLHNDTKYFRVNDNVDLKTLGDDFIYEKIKYELFNLYVKRDDRENKIYFPVRKPNGIWYKHDEVVEEFVGKFGENHGYNI